MVGHGIGGFLFCSRGWGGEIERSGEEEGGGGGLNGRRMSSDGGSWDPLSSSSLDVLGLFLRHANLEVANAKADAGMTKVRVVFTNSSVSIGT